MAAADGGSTGVLAESLSTMGSQPWEVQEVCYGALLKLLGNVVRNPGEAKFRSIKRGNAAIKAKVLDCPGGVGLLLAAGFVEEPEVYVLPESAPLDLVQTALDQLQSHATAKSDANFRAERDAKLAKEKAIDAKLASFGGFARGVHKLGSGNTPPADVQSTDAAGSVATEPK
uniref:PUB domain-containing protein n=1 Tax=Prorocentrum minimum TaxID=39449 RepID=A9P6R6_PROMN|nr:unknown [Prorocentrum minimum]